MTSKAQRYWLVFHSRADESISVDQKHVRFFKGIQELPTPWGLGERPVPPIPKFKGGSSASVGLTKFFGDGVHRAMLSYRYRRMLSDDGLSDDLLNITFSPAKVDVHHLVCTVIPKYVEAFDAYLVEFFDDAMIDLAAEELKGVAVNPRSIVHRVGVVSFFDDLLCRRAFNLSPAEVMERLQGKVEHAQLLHGGVYLVGSSRVLPLDEAMNLCQEMKKALLG
ncbi:MAG: hypothetical protein U0840_28375 [Gemmataceae bacterium]